MSVELTDDERTVLLIADGGESMMPLGRWEQPVEHLVELGYLERHDKFNNVITEKGRLAINAAEEGVSDDFAKALIARHNAGIAYRQKGNEIAQKLVELTKELAVITGDDPATALTKCSDAIWARAKELLNGN